MLMRAPIPVGPVRSVRQPRWDLRYNSRGTVGFGSRFTGTWCCLVPTDRGTSNLIKVSAVFVQSTLGRATHGGRCRLLLYGDVMLLDAPVLGHVSIVLLADHPRACVSCILFRWKWSILAAEGSRPTVLHLECRARYPWPE